MKTIISTTSILCLFFFHSCSHQKEDTLFQWVPISKSGLTFTNQVMETDSFNILTFSNIYTGGGVGIGDFNGDDWPDVFFSGNNVSSQLYLNQSQHSQKYFKEATKESGINTNQWISGVSVVDLNQDGKLDIYLCSTGSDLPKRRANLLYINQGNNEAGIPQFIEMAANYGIADTSYTTHSAFFDYDRDGDLDLFLIVNFPELYYGGQVNIPKQLKAIGAPHKSDRLYRNDGLGPNGHPHFTEVSHEAGIFKEGYSLGLAIGDINQDGWPDIYVANDYLSDDILYLNNGDGTFTDKIRAHIDHTSYAGMGVDISDINNDGLLDIAELDMLPRDPKRLKSMIAGVNYNKYEQRVQAGYTYQFTRNTLQINQKNNQEPGYSYSEVGQLAGIHDSDWSWSVLMGDYDNDGFKDLWITNGFYRDLSDLDFINFGFETETFTPEFVDQKFIEQAHQLPGIYLSNFIFQNQHNLTFKDQSKNWGIDRASYSNGASFLDFDQDGDLDLICNNLKDPAFLFENTSESKSETPPHFIKIKLQGKLGNTHGIGSKICLFTKDQIQYQEYYLTKGYLSSVDPVLHFGLGDFSTIDSLILQWPDGTVETLFNLPADQTLILNQKNALKPAAKKAASNSLPTTKNIQGLDYLHQEGPFLDFNYQRLLPHRQSQFGPGIAIGDINQDGLDDLFVGAGRKYRGKLFVQGANQTFNAQELEYPNRCEDMGSLFFDVDQDNDLDLYVVSGSVELGKEHPLYQDHLFLNDGHGQFTRTPSLLPDHLQYSGSVVTAADYDRDGDLDLFVGGGAKPSEYPLCSNSALLKNELKEQGQFVDETLKVEGLEKVGIVKSALWTDVNGDNWLDLLLVGEFMPITLFINQEGSLILQKENGLENTYGWWNSLQSGDFDADGDLDYIAGNFGWNTRYNCSVEHPLCIYLKDFDQNGTKDPILCEFVEDKEIPLAYRDDLLAQLVHLKSQFTNYTSYAEADLQEVFTSEKLEEAKQFNCQTMSTSYIENLGNGQFKVRALPVETQFSPVFGIVVDHFNQDEHLDAFLVGNFYGNETSAGKYDASNGTLLFGNGQGAFEAAPSNGNPFYVPGEARSLATITMSNDQPYLLVGQNRDSLLKMPYPHSYDQFIDIKPNEFKAIITPTNGKARVQEFYYGSGYLSQSSRKLKINHQAKVEFFNYDGTTRVVNLPE